MEIDPRYTLSSSGVARTWAGAASADRGLWSWSRIACRLTLATSVDVWVYVALVTDAYARRILGWRVGITMTPRLVLDALEQAIWARERLGQSVEQVVAHSDRGSQYTSIRYSERVAVVGIGASVGSVGDS